MTLQFELVRAVLVFELLAFTALVSIPLKWRAPTLRRLCHSTRLQAAWKGGRVAMVLISLLFLDSLMNSMRLRRLHSAIKVAELQQQGGLQGKMFYAQRNLYLCGFTLAMAIVLNRVLVMALSEATLREQLDAFKKNSGVLVRDSPPRETSTKEASPKEASACEPVSPRQQASRVVKRMEELQELARSAHAALRHGCKEGSKDASNEEEDEEGEEDDKKENFNQSKHLHSENDNQSEENETDLLLKH